jgi:hypothetical protein
MAELWQNYAPFVPKLMQDMALFFLRFRPASAGSTEYCQLVELIKDGTIKDVLFSTLNYECIFECALALQGLNIDPWGHGQDNAIPVWKLHGSCNFRSAELQATGVFFGNGVSFTGPIHQMQPREAFQYWNAPQSLPPVMSMYMKKKYSQTSHEQLLHLQVQCQECCRGRRPSTS